VDDGTEPIADDELLYRRVPLVWYSTTSGLDDQAFHPHKTLDVTGISVSRAKYKTIEEAAQGRPDKSYFVAVLLAGQLRENGITVEPRPEPNDPGHSELPDLNAANRREDRSLNQQRLLRELTLRVEGPFAPRPTHLE
jgi:hypothetical protein